MKNLKIYALVAAMALLVPAGAIAKRPENKPAKGKAHAPKVHLATANVKGTVTANDGSTMTVTVDRASGHAKACKGQSLTFDVSQARFHVADNDADGDRDAADVLVGHAVKVRGKVAITRGRKTACSVTEGQVLPARAVHDRTTPKVDDGDDAEDTTGDTDTTETETPES